jgi:hypothetical protein
MNIGYLEAKKNERPTEAECPEDEQNGRSGNEEWTSCSCESVPPTFNAFEAGKDKARASTGHG